MERETGYYASGTRPRTKMHATVGRKPICGARVRPAHFQVCGHGWHAGLIECAHCQKAIRRKP
jgi:hypothetical protein